MSHGYRSARRWILLASFLCVSNGPVLAADAGWQFLNGPQGAFVHEVERAPSDPDILYAATSGDLYKSNDGGATWQPLGLKRPVLRVAVHPQNSSIVLAGTDRGQLAKTVDGGATWVVQKPAFIISSNPVMELEIDPSTPDTAYAVLATSSFSSYAPIIKTVDGGTTWTQAGKGLTIQENPPLYLVISSLALDPQNPSILYTVETFGSVYRSLDGASTWAWFPSTGLHSGAATLEIDPTDSSYFFAGLFTGGVHRSEDGGVHWVESNDGLIAAFTQDFAFGPGDPPTLYGATLRGIYRSDNRAQSWVPANGGISDLVMTSVLADPSDPLHLYTGGSVGVFETSDGGTTWAPRIEGLFHRFVLLLLVDRSDPSTVLAATASGVLHRSVDRGQTWPPLPVDGLGKIASLVAAPSDPSILYLGSISGRVFRSSDHGLSWTEVQPAGGISDTVAALAVHPSNPQIVYAGLGSSFGPILVRSSNGGDTWSPSNAGLANAVQSVVIDRQNPSILYAGLKGGVFKSIDGGASWSQLSGGLPVNHLAQFRAVIDPRTSVVYVLTQFDGLFRSLDGGASWQPIHPGLPSKFVNTLLIDPNDSSVLYAAPAANGVYRSPDRGETWGPLNDGLPVLGSPKIDVYSLAMASSERRLYAGVFSPDFPSGVYGRLVPVPSLFFDGFESGDLTAWSPTSLP